MDNEESRFWEAKGRDLIAQKSELVIGFCDFPLCVYQLLEKNKFIIGMFDFPLCFLPVLVADNSYSMNYMPN